MRYILADRDVKLQHAAPSVSILLDKARRFPFSLCHRPGLARQSAFKGGSEKGRTIAGHGTQQKLSLVRSSTYHSENEYSRGEVSRRQKARIDFLRRGESAEIADFFLAMADSRSVPRGSELPRCVLHGPAFWNHFKFWQTRLFLV